VKPEGLLPCLKEPNLNQPNLFHTLTQFL